jgi:hypothetical protein
MLLYFSRVFSSFYWVVLFVVTTFVAQVLVAYSIRGYVRSSRRNYVIPRNAEAVRVSPLIVEAERADAGVTVLACAMFRIWPGDLFRMRGRHVKDWVGYMKWAGATRVRMYDNCHSEDECQGFLRESSDYVKWPRVEYAGAQRDAIQDCIDTAKSENITWVLSCDIDEYPFSLVDRRAGFITRLIASQSPHVSQILFRSMFFGGSDGVPLNESDALYDHFVYRATSAEGEHHRTKPLFIASFAASHQPNIVHEMVMDKGVTNVADLEIARLNHYWGFRLDRPRDVLVLDRSVQYVAK